MQLGIRLHDTKKLPFEERIANVHELRARGSLLTLGER